MARRKTAATPDAGQEARKPGRPHGPGDGDAAQPAWRQTGAFFKNSPCSYYKSPKLHLSGFFSEKLQRKTTRERAREHLRPLALATRRRRPAAWAGGGARPRRGSAGGGGPSPRAPSRAHSGGDTRAETPSGFVLRGRGRGVWVEEASVSTPGWWR